MKRLFSIFIFVLLAAGSKVVLAQGAFSKGEADLSQAEGATKK